MSHERGRLQAGRCKRKALSPTRCMTAVLPAFARARRELQRDSHRRLVRGPDSCVKAPATGFRRPVHLLFVQGSTNCRLRQPGRAVVDSHCKAADVSRGAVCLADRRSSAITAAIRSSSEKGISG